MKLNIIGNGFDLYHGLPSYYYHFGCYLIDNDPEFYEEIGRMYGIKIGRQVGPAICHDYEHAVQSMFWREFEVSLGKVVEDYIIGTHGYDLMLENPDPIEIEMNEYQIAEKIKNAFSNWVKKTLDTDENYDIIKSLMNNKSNLLDMKDKDYFIVFNYTHVLQEVYNIPEENIHYIHGECLGTEEDDLVVGHGDCKRIEEIENYIQKLENDYQFTQSSRNEIDEYECLVRILKILKKDVDLCKNLAKKFYYNIGEEIKEVKIYGLSFGEVDIPYLQQIRELWPHARWKFSYHLNDKDRAINVAENILKLTQNEYSIFQLYNPKSDFICSLIVNNIGLNLYPSL